jgi:integrase
VFSSAPVGRPAAASPWDEQFPGSGVAIRSALLNGQEGRQDAAHRGGGPPDRPEPDPISPGRRSEDQAKADSSGASWEPRSPPGATPSFGTGRATDALTEEQAAAPLAKRPYDLRHACVFTWLNHGVPAPQVADWAGHSVAVLLRVYAKCLDGGAADALAKLSQARRK